MAAVAFDPLAYAHELEATGVSREQAEVHAKAMTTMFIHNFDALVTNDYLDTRFTEFDARVEKQFSEFETRVEKRFAEFETRVEKRFTEFETRVEKRSAEFEFKVDKQFSEIESSVDVRFAKVDTSFAKIHTELRWLKWLVVTGIAATVWPAVIELVR